MSRLIHIFFLVLGLSILGACSKTNPMVSQNVNKLTANQRQGVIEDLKLGQVHLTTTPVAADNCQAFIASLPGDYTADYLDVPEDWSQPAGRKIKVFYYGQINGATNPVIFYNGGPASDSHSSYSNISRTSDSKTLNFIYMDQRGTGCSSPFPDEPNTETVQRLKNYSSRSIVKDSEYLREKLFGPGSKWKIFGQSYGGLIVHRYATVAPQSVVSAHAHGLSIMTDEVQWIKLRMLSQKRVVQNYLLKYPSDDVKIKKLRSLVTPDMCYAAGSTRICGNAAVDALTIFLGFSSAWPSMHQTLSTLIVNDSLNAAAYKIFVQNYVLGVFGNQYAAGSVLSWMDMGGEKPALNYCPEVEQKLAADGENTNEWLIDECRVLSAFQDASWDPLLTTIGSFDPLTLTQFKKSITDAQLPFYLYSGHLDVFVPFETFAEETSYLGNVIHYQSFQNSGHEGFLTEPLVWQNLR